MGSPRAITNAWGLVTWRQDYKAFGSDYGTVATGNSYKFNGKPLEANTGLYYYGARFYDPNIGRFVSCDLLIGKLHEPQTWNPYAYCGNNPQTYIDPQEEDTISVFSTIVNIFCTLLGAPWAAVIISGFLSYVDYKTNYGTGSAGLVFDLIVGSITSLMADSWGSVGTVGILKMNPEKLGTAIVKGAIAGAIGAGLGAAIANNGDIKSNSFWQDVGWGSIGGAVMGALVWQRNKNMIDRYRDECAHYAAEDKNSQIIKASADFIDKQNSISGQSLEGYKEMNRCVDEGILAWYVDGALGKGSGTTLYDDIMVIDRSKTLGWYAEMIEVGKVTWSEIIFHEMLHMYSLGYNYPNGVYNHYSPSNLVKENDFRRWLGLSEKRIKM